MLVRGGVQGDELTAGHGHGGLAEFGLGKQASGRAMNKLQENFSNLGRLSSRDVGVLDFAGFRD